MKFQVEDQNGFETFFNVRLAGISIGTIESDASVSGRGAITDSHGNRVNRLEKGRYQVVSTGEIFTSNDPNAP